MSGIRGMSDAGNIAVIEVGKKQAKCAACYGGVSMSSQERQGDDVGQEWWVVSPVKDWQCTPRTLRDLL